MGRSGQLEPGPERKDVLAIGTLPASTEPHTIIVPAPLEEGIFPILAWADVDNEAGSTDEYSSFFGTPFSSGLGEPFIESLTASNITAKGATIEATYGIEAPKGAVHIGAECGNEEHRDLEYEKVLFKKFKRQSGTQTAVEKLRVKKKVVTECRINMEVANAAEGSLRETHIIVPLTG